MPNLSCSAALQGYGCFCSPCVAQPPSAAASAFGGLRVSGFAVILTVIPSLIVVAILLVCFYTVRKHRTNSSIPNAIAYSELHIGTHSEVLGEGAHGLILKGTFCGVAVSVKRLLAPSNPAYPSAFDFEVNSKKSLDFGAGAAYLARTKSSTSQMQASPSPNRAQRRRSSFLELVSDNLQVQLLVRICMLCPVKTTANNTDFAYCNAATRVTHLVIHKSWMDPCPCLLLGTEGPPNIMPSGPSRFTHHEHASQVE